MVAGSNPAVPTLLILLSNDDGVHSEGLNLLARDLQKIARVVVVAPHQEQSATSHSITLHRPLRVRRLKRDVYAIDGTPTDCVTLGFHEILKGKKPDLIVSGINHGANLGDDVHYSGTVSVAMEGAMLGIPSVAFSLVILGEKQNHFRTASRFALKLCRRLSDYRLPSGVMLNVNIPNRSQAPVAEVTKLGKRSYGEIIFEKIDPRGKKYYWIGGNEKQFVNIPRSDCNAIRAGHISVTPLQVDITHYPVLEELRGLKL
ncbi:MAG: 5'/3'-nucleotidase SurE [Deltaproteobacteria bacterium]|nr:5'/3'-nucleotidase SurE [Deltaproteobacteria bacterium]